jgi:hypothetical protein
VCAPMANMRAQLIPAGKWSAWRPLVDVVSTSAARGAPVAFLTAFFVTRPPLAVSRALSAGWWLDQCQRGTLHGWGLWSSLTSAAAFLLVSPAAQPNTIRDRCADVARRPPLQRLTSLISQHQLGDRPAPSRHEPCLQLLTEFPAHDIAIQRYRIFGRHIRCGVLRFSFVCAGTARSLAGLWRNARNRHHVVRLPLARRNKTLSRSWLSCAVHLKYARMRHVEVLNDAVSNPIQLLRVGFGFETHGLN